MDTQYYNHEKKEWTTWEDLVSHVGCGSYMAVLNLKKNRLLIVGSTMSEFSLKEYYKFYERRMSE